MKKLKQSDPNLNNFSRYITEGIKYEIQKENRRIGKAFSYHTYTA